MKSAIGFIRSIHGIFSFLCRPKPNNKRNKGPSSTTNPLSGETVIVVKMPPAMTSVTLDSRAMEINTVNVDSTKLRSITINQYLTLTIITV